MAIASDWPWQRIDGHIASRMRRRRSMVGMSQRALAAAVGVTYQQIRKYELGINCVSGGRLYAIAAALGVPVSFFFEEFPAPSAPPPATGDPADFAPVRKELLDVLYAYRALPGGMRREVYKLLTTLAHPKGDRMRGYRVYFLDPAGRIGAVHWFETESDEAAWWMAERLYGACSDACADFELWQGSRKLDAAPRTPEAGGGRLEAMVARRQEMLVRHEEALRDSTFHIAKSRRLLDALDRAKNGGKGDA